MFDNKADGVLEDSENGVLDEEYDATPTPMPRPMFMFGLLVLLGAFACEEAELYAYEVFGDAVDDKLILV